MPEDLQWHYFTLLPFLFPLSGLCICVEMQVQSVGVDEITPRAFSLWGMGGVEERGQDPQEMQAKSEGQSEAGEDDIPLGRGAKSRERGRMRISFKHTTRFKTLTLVPGTVLEFRDAGVGQENVRSVHSFTHSFIYSTLLSVMCQMLFWILKLCFCS